MVNGKVVVITGAAHGIGRAIASVFAARGCRVALLDLDGERAERAAGEISAGGATALGLACDVTEPAQCVRAVSAVRERWGGVDVLVNNAGISHRSRFEETDPQVIRRVMEVNFFGAVNCTHAALPSLLERRGAIVAISSVAGVAPLVGRSGYAASKHALHGFFDSLRAELRGRGVAVTLVCPSFVDTGIDDRALGGDGRALGRGAKQTIGRPASPDAVARVVLAAVEERRAFVTVGGVGKASYWVSRLAPRVYESIMVSRQGREFGL